MKVMNSDANIQLVLSFYEAFKRGDIQAILDRVADKVEWILPAEGQIPWGGTRRSRQEVAEFFQMLNERVEYGDLNARETLAQDDRVIALGDSVATIRANGKSVPQEWVMAWTIQEGKVTHHRYYDDTAKWVAALQG